MKDCIFCKLANDEVPCLKVYEDEFTFSMMDTAGDVDGHSGDPQEALYQHPGL